MALKKNARSLLFLLFYDTRFYLAPQRKTTKLFSELTGINTNLKKPAYFI